ncbi:hypothetical protein [Pseudomonas piscis]|uniref:hypothetical protein n=1 Tax=Pseudomonas piscis TaxID=2614538 RepID=UPI0021D58B0F|nr:hypothetical protein [Pseudomonas piscis]MCU7648581.1 hypothetical protein [Pseudomonas piscis]
MKCASPFFLHYLVNVLTAERAALQARSKPHSNAGMGDERITLLAASQRQPCPHRLYPSDRALLLLPDQITQVINKASISQ